MEKELKIKISVDKKTGALKVMDGEFRELSRTTAKSSKSTDSFKKSLTDIDNKIKSMVQAGASLYILKQAFDLTSEISATGMKLESMTMSLEAAVGSVKLAKKEIDYLKNTTDDLGLVFETSLDGFTQFSAAAKQTILEGKGVEEIFTGVSSASAVMGLNVDNQNGVFRALSQMMSKGKIAAEELRGQLGERLPGAFQIAARSMNMTTSELDKFMSDGKLLSEDFLPKFGSQLQKEFGEKAVLAAHTARAEQARYNNSLLDMKLAINDAGVNEFTKEFYQLGNVVLKEATHWLHEWNIQANEMKDINKNSGTEKLKEQYILATAELGRLQLQEKSFQQQVSARSGILDIAGGYLKSEVGLNAEIIKQKALIWKLEKTINQSIEESTKVKDINNYGKKTGIALTDEEIKAQEKLAKENEKVYASFINITGSDYDKWLSSSNSKMVELSKNGVLSAQQLANAWSALENLTPDAIKKVELQKEFIDLKKEEYELTTNEYTQLLDNYNLNVEKYKDISGSKEDIDKWYFAKLEKLNEKYLKDYEKDTLKTHKKIDDEIVSLWGNATSSMANTFETNFFDAIMGKGDAFKDFFNQIAKDVATPFARNISQGVTGGLASFMNIDLTKQQSLKDMGLTLKDGVWSGSVNGTDVQVDSGGNVLKGADALSKSQSSSIGEYAMAAKTGYGMFTNGGIGASAAMYSGSATNFAMANMGMSASTAGNIDGFIYGATNPYGAASGSGGATGAGAAFGGAAIGAIGGYVVGSLGDKLFGAETQAANLAAIGGAIGSLAGPIGTVAGIAIGSVIGGAFGSTKMTGSGTREILMGESGYYGYTGKILSSDSNLGTLSSDSLKADDMHYQDYKYKSWFKSSSWTKIQIEQNQQLADDLKTVFKAYDGVLAEFGKGTLSVAGQAVDDIQKFLDEDVAKAFLNQQGSTDKVYYLWARYADSVNQSTLEAISTKVAEYQQTINTWAVYELNAQGMEVAALAKQAEIAKRELTKIQDAAGAYGVTLTNFDERFTQALSTNLTPEMIDKWNLLGNNLKAATDAQKAYDDSLKQNKLTLLGMIDPAKQNAMILKDALDSLGIVNLNDSSFENVVNNYIENESLLTTERKASLDVAYQELAARKQINDQWKANIEGIISQGGVDTVFASTMSNLSNELNSFISSIRTVVNTLDNTLSKIQGSRDSIALAGGTAAEQEFYLLSRYNETLSTFQTAQTAFFDNPTNIDASSAYTSSRDTLLSTIDTYSKLVDTNGLDKASLNTMDGTLSDIYNATTVEQQLMAEQLQELQDIQSNTFKQNEQMLAINTNIAEQLKLQIKQIQDAKDAITPTEFAYDTSLSGIATNDGFKFTDLPDFAITMANGDVIRREYATLDEAIAGLKDLVAQYPTEYLYNQAKSAIDMYSKMGNIIPSLDNYLNLSTIKYNMVGSEVYTMMQDLGKSVEDSKMAASYAEALAWTNAKNSGQLSASQEQYLNQGMYWSGYSDTGRIYQVGQSDAFYFTRDLSELLGSLVGFGNSNITLDADWYRYVNNLSDGSQGYRYPSYDVGTSYVPEDQLAQIHKSEKIIDPQSSAILNKYGIKVNPMGGGTSYLMELVNEIKKLNDKTKTIEAQNAILVDIIHKYVDAEDRKDRKARALEFSA
jgi:tape measure domain-containing protein